MNTFDQDQQAAIVQRHLEKQEQILKDWIAVNPQYANTANILAIKEYYHSEDWSYENLSESAALLAAKGVITRLKLKTSEDIAAEEWEERLELVEFILANGGYQPESAVSERARFLRRVNGKNGSDGFPVVNIDTLRQMKSNIETQRRLSPLTKDQLKKKVHQEWVDTATAKYGRPGMWKPLPEIYTNGGGGKMLLKNAPPETMRTLIKTCGVEQINFYLARRTED